MFGIILVSLGTFTGELSDSLGKLEVKKRVESLYTMGFLSVFWAAVLLVATVPLGATFVFRLASLRTFIPRVGFELLGANLTIRAIVKADRSTFSFLRILTIPLLLLVDLRLGYAISAGQIVGIGLMLVALYVLLHDGNRSRRGAGLAFLTALNAVVTISLYKYDISHYNSVAGEQVIVTAILLAYFIVMSLRAGQKPWRFLWRPIPGLQSFSSGAGGVLEGFAYKYAPASIILTLKRALGVLWSILFGNAYFKEKHLRHKLVALGLIVVGLYLITVSTK